MSIISKDNKKFGMGLSGIDTFKLSLLALMVIICMYSAVVKFSPSASVFWKSPKLQPNLNFCVQFSDDQYKLCVDVVTKATKEADKRCYKYIKTLASCQIAHTSDCSIQQNNVESCVTPIIEKSLTDNGLLSVDEARMKSMKSILQARNVQL